MKWADIFGLLRPKSKASVAMAEQAIEAGIDGTLVLQIQGGKVEAFFTTGRAELVIR